MGFYTRINELRNLGYVIDCIPEKHINKRGRQVVRGRYVLRSEPRASPKEPKEQETPLTDSTP